MKFIELTVTEATHIIPGRKMLINIDDIKTITEQEKSTGVGVLVTIRGGYYIDGVVVDNMIRFQDSYQEVLGKLDGKYN